ncbi:MAG: acyltransferase [Selenomonas sp.]|nr:acyltransferase [Selenomonas sp.]
MTLYYRWEILNCKVKLIVYKLLYGNKIKIKSGFHVRKGFTLFVDNGATVNIGKNVFFNRYCSINAMDNITIGDNCLFGENIKIYDHDHKFRNFDQPISKQGFRVAPINIGNNCWIGSNVIILKGVHIGNHVVVGAGCLITKDIPDNVLVKSDKDYAYIEMDNGYKL